MKDSVKSFKELTPRLMNMAGNKGGRLAWMTQKGYPVPEGFVVFPAAFQEDKLDTDAWQKIKACLKDIRMRNKGALFAIRSSALCEDSALASFAGAFETVLKVKTDEKILEAIYTVFRSGESERVKVYSSARGMEQSHQMAVVVQRMVPSEISGVLFTADPVTGSYTSMPGNYVYGLGDPLVSGEATAHTFKLIRPEGTYEGPGVMRRYAAKLFKWAVKLENGLGSPQDIEWAIAAGKLYLLQTRPVTTLIPANRDTYAINESLAEDALWVNTNVGEAIPDVITPLSWSIIRTLDNESGFIPGYYLWSGNICGRIYSNISRRVSAISTLYNMDIKRSIQFIGEFFGRIPETINMPVYPFSRIHLMKMVFPRVMLLTKNMKKALKNREQHLRDTPVWCLRMTERIQKAKTREELLFLWESELKTHNSQAWWSLFAGGSKAVFALSLHEKLTGMVGMEDANTLLSNLRGSSGLASLGPVLGIAQVIKGELSCEEYMRQYGHRSPHEFELSLPDPSENNKWLEKQIEAYKKADTGVEELLKQQHTRYIEAKRRFQEHYPRKIKWLEKKIANASQYSGLREAFRAEFVRVFRVIRTFALKAGVLTEIGDDIFFLYVDEVIHLLSGDTSALKYIEKRKENYEKYNTLPPFPSIIRGRFDPFKWVNEKNRRMDYYDAASPVVAPSGSKILKGFAGAAGKIEGLVRIMKNPEEGEKLLPGEILVTTTTNIGWTPLFPRAAAIITDIGAPLSHTAIVARELGIPAVVGCGNATTTLKTGDRVLVDGGQGTVHILF